MKPVLFTLGNIPVIGVLPISSFGLFLLISFVVSSFAIWRIVKLYELDPEQSFDLIFLTIIGGLFGARLYFILFHLSLFNSVNKVFLLNHYPGLSFWGGFLGGLLTLRFFSKRFKLNFWQIADYAIVGTFLGMAISGFGCLLGSCQYGLQSTGFFSVPQAGLIGRRFPLQIVESALYFLTFLYFWRLSLKFHVPAQIFSKALLYLGVIKLILESFRGDKQLIFQNISLGAIWAILLIIYSIRVYYQHVPAVSRGSKRSFLSDLGFILSLPINKSKRHIVISNINKNWYNLIVDLRVNGIRLKRWIFKLLNIKSTPNNLK